MNLISRGYQILVKRGPISLLHKTTTYLGHRIYFGLKSHHTHSIGNIKASFIVPNTSIGYKNKSRFTSEQSIISDLLRELKTEDVFYDVGANMGLYTIFGGKSCSEVIAFEPYSPNLKMLRKNIRHNNLSNVQLYGTALSDTDGKISFNVSDEATIGCGTPSIVNNEKKNSVKVATKRGDDLTAEDGLPSPNVVKIDVEGAEALVISGLEDTLRSPDCRVIYCEIHRSTAENRPTIHDFGATLEGITSTLSEYGFTVEKKKIRGKDVFLKGYK